HLPAHGKPTRAERRQPPQAQGPFAFGDASHEQIEGPRGRLEEGPEDHFGIAQTRDAPKKQAGEERTKKGTTAFGTEPTQGEATQDRLAAIAALVTHGFVRETPQPAMRRHRDEQHPSFSEIPAGGGQRRYVIPQMLDHVEEADASELPSRN